MSINFEPVASDVAAQMSETVHYILSLDISAAEKVNRIVRSFNLVGSDFYVQMFGASSEVFDTMALSSMGYDEMLAQVERLGTKLVRNYALDYEIDPIVKDFYDSVLGKAMNEAFSNALSLDKHPTLTRSIVGETCSWCIARQGTFVNPDSEYFSRHRDCDCLLVVSGYNTRNGVLNNYVKKEEKAK